MTVMFTVNVFITLCDIYLHIWENISENGKGKRRLERMLGSRENTITVTNYWTPCVLGLHESSSYMLACCRAASQCQYLNQGVGGRGVNL